MLVLSAGSVLGLLPIPFTVSLCELAHSQGFSGFIFLISTSLSPAQISLPNQPHGHCLLGISLWMTPRPPLQATSQQNQMPATLSTLLPVSLILRVVPPLVRLSSWTSESHP